MKKIIKPAEREEAVYYSDFKGIPFNECGPDIELDIRFNYGSQYDGSRLILHLSDEEFEPLLNLIKEKLSFETKKEFKKLIDKLDDDYEASIDSRDFYSCHCVGNNLDLLKQLI